MTSMDRIFSLYDEQKKEEDISSDREELADAISGDHLSISESPNLPVFQIHREKLSWIPDCAWLTHACHALSMR